MSDSRVEDSSLPDAPGNIRDAERAAWDQRVEDSHAAKELENLDPEDLQYSVWYTRFPERRWLRARMGVDLTGKRVLDCGCGVGAESLRFASAGASVGGVDISPASVEIARTYAERDAPDAEIDFIASPIEEVEWPENHFDLIYGASILHHLPDLALAARHLKRVLKPGGLCAFVEPLSANPILRLARNDRVWWLRYPGKAHTPGERPLSYRDYNVFVDEFDEHIYYEYGLSGQCLRLIPSGFWGKGPAGRRRYILARKTFSSIDAVLRAFPPFRPLCRFVAILGMKNADGTP